jgi:type IV pilus assembly protein PilE
MPTGNRTAMPRTAALRTARGFTLIEVMITVAIVAILSAIAMPAYNAYVQRSRIPPGLEALTSLATRLEQRYQDTGSYANGDACGATLPTASNFTISCVLSDEGQGFTATATGNGAVEGYAYTINHRGVRRTTAHPKGAPETDCWSLKGGVCDS